MPIRRERERRDYARIDTPAGPVFVYGRPPGTRTGLRGSIQLGDRVLLVTGRHSGVAVSISPAPGPH